MSNTIDEKVVEMRFDNKDFETNIKDTMKTLDEFKKQLKFEGASEGFDNIGKNVNKINFDSLSNAIDTVNDRFSALGIIGMRVLENITDRVMLLGERLIKMVTINPITDGLKEYELQIDAVQTIMANTGDSVEVVNKALDELNEYADLTIYNFSEMTRNVGTFTAALGKGSLELSTKALKGIGNWAAYAGASSEDMARASQYLAQGLQNGFVSLRTWYSVMHTRGMAGENFREEFKQTAREIGIDVDSIIEKAGSFNESLQQGWLTTDVFMKTMEKFADNEAMTNAATKIKTFSQLVGVIKEALGTGWATTWRLIIGDFEEAKETFSRIGDFLTGENGIITKISDARNELVKSAMGKTIGEFAQKFKDIVKPIEKSADSVKKVVDSVQDYTKVVDEIISGKWGNGQSRWDALTKAGYDWAHAQNLVNEKLGSSVRHAENFSEKQEELVQSEEKVSEATKNYIEELVNLSDAELKAQGYNDEQIKDFRNLKETADKLGLSVSELIDKSDKLNGRYMLIESFANIGKALISILSSIGKAWSEIFTPISADNLFDIITGMYKFSNIIKNYVESNAENLTRTLKGLFAILSVIGNIVKGVLNVGFNAFKIVMSLFGKTTSGVLDITANLGDVLVLISDILNKYIIIGFNKIIDLMNNGTTKIKEFIFNNTLLSNSFNFLKDKFFNIITSIKEYITNNEKLQDAFSKLKDKIEEIKNKIVEWLDKNDVLNNILETFSNTIERITTNIKNFIDNNETLQNIFSTIKTKIDEAKTSLEKWFETLSKDNGVGKSIIDGIANGLSYGISKVVEAIKKVAEKIKTVFCNLLGIHSPSTVFMEYGKNIILGLIDGLKSMFPNITNIFEDIYNKIKNISFGSVADILFPLTSLVPALGFLNLPRHFLNLFKACGIQSLAGLQEGLQNKTGVIGTIIDLANKIITAFKSILGINSPSKVFIEFGKNILDGLINGVKSGFTKILNLFSELSNKIVEGFKKINFGNIAAIILATSMFVLVGKLIKIVSSLGFNIAKGFADSLKAQKIQAEANKIKSIGEAVRDIGITIALIAASIFLISKIEEPWKAFAVIGAISGCVIAMYGLITLISHFDKTNQASKGTNTVLKIAASVLLIAVAINLISKYKIGDESIDVMVGLISVIGLFIALIKITMLAGPNADKAGDMILKISASILLMIVVIKLINKMSLEEITKGIAVIGALGGLIFLFIKFLKASENDFKSISIMVLAMSASIILLIMAIKMINKITIGEIAKGIAVIGALGGLIFLFVKFLKASENDFKSIGLMALAMSASIVLIIAAIKMINSMTVGELIKGGVVITALGALIVLFINTLKASGSDFKSIGIMVLTISGAILLLVGALMLLTKIDAKELYTRIPIILAIGVLFGKLIATANSAKNAMGTIITLTVALSMLIGAVALLTLLDQDKLKNATICVVALIGVLSVLIGVSKFAGGLKQTLSVIPMLILVLGMTIGAIFLMSLMDTEKALTNVIALSVLLGALTITLLALKLVKTPSVAGLASLGALTLVILALTGILYLLQDIDATKVIPNIIALSVMLLSMTGVLAALTIIGMAGPAAIIGVGSLAALIIALTGALIGLGALVNKFPQVEEFINKGETIFLKLGEILGGFVGNIITGITSSFMDILPMIGTKLSEFMENLGPFLTGINSVDGNVAKNAGYLALAILTISSSEIIAGIASFIPNASGFGQMGSDLSTFMTNAKPFFDGVSQISPETLQGVLVLSKAILALTAGELLQGITKFIGGGEVDLSKFGSQLAGLADGINTFAEKVKDIDSKAVEKVKAACEAITAIADANSKIPNSGGWLANIVGDNKIDEFGDAMPKLGAGLNGFVNALNGFNDSKLPIVTAACEAIKKIADVNNSIPNSGGWLANIIGDNDIGQFGVKIAVLGAGLNSFIANLKDFTTDSSPIVESACNAIKKLADLGNSIGDSGWYSKLLGESDLEKFSKSIPELGKGINGFVSQLSDFSSDKVAIVNSACEAITSISNLGNIDLATLSSNLNDFGINLTNFGADIYTFVSLLEEVGLETIQASIEKVKNLIDMASTIASVSIESLSTFSTSLTQIATEGVYNFCQAFSGEEPLEQVRQAILMLIQTIIDTLLSKQQEIYNTFITLMNKAIEAMKSKKQEFINVTMELCNAVLDTFSNYYDAMYQVGCDFTMGFVEGLRSKIEEAARAAAEMARAALAAAKAAIDSNSPSKETMELGGFFGEGFMLGIKSYSGKVYSEAYNTGDMAKEGLSKAISKIKSIIEDGIDTSPTIRPVLDLSDIESGFSTLNGMFNNNSIAVDGNIASISNGFNSQIQNGYNNDLLEAINKLDTDIKGSGGNVLNIYTQELDSAKLDQIVKHVNKEFGIVYYSGLNKRGVWF